MRKSGRAVMWARRLARWNGHPVTADRRGARPPVCEQMEPRLLLSATIATDLADYAFGSTAVITGTGFASGETVRLQVTNTPPTQGSMNSPQNDPWLVTDGGQGDLDGAADGNISTSWLVNDPDAVGATYSLTAAGLTSGETASTTFADSGSLGYIANTDALSVRQGESTSFFQILTAPANNGSFSASVHVVATGSNAIPGSWVRTDPPSLSFATSLGFGDLWGWTVYFTVPSGATPGTYTAQIKALPSIPGVDEGPGTPMTLTVTSASVPTQLTDVSGIGTYGSSAILSATLMSGLDPISGETVSFSLDGGATFVGSGVTDNNGVARFAMNGQDAGAYSLYARFAGDSSSSPARDSSGGTGALTIAKADVTIDVAGYDGIYDGKAHGATGSATGVLGEGLSGLDLGASFTNVPGGIAHWTFTDTTGNYNDVSGSVAISIAKADAVIVVTPYSVTYDGHAHAATGTAEGVLGEGLSGLDLSQTAHTNAGTYADSWTFTDSTGNYNDATMKVTDSIDQELLGVTVTTKGALKIAKAGTIAFKVTVTDPCIVNGVSSLDQLTLAQLFNGATIDVSLDGTAYSAEVLASVMNNAVVFRIRMSAELRSALCSRNSTGTKGVEMFSVSGDSNGGNYTFDADAMTRLFLQRKLAFRPAEMSHRNH